MKNNSLFGLSEKNIFYLILILFSLFIILFLFRYLRTKIYIIEGNQEKQECKFNSEDMESTGKDNAKNSNIQAKKISENDGKMEDTINTFSS